MFENVKEDWKREYKRNKKKSRLRIIFNCLWSPGFQAAMGYRTCRWLVRRRIPLLNVLIQRFVEIFTGISIPPTAYIGKGLLIEHFGGIVVNASSEIGEFCTFSHNVTVGNKIPGGASPRIGDNVYICVGAKILGDITVGNNCIIGANAVVLKSIPKNAVVAGVPAKVIRTFDPLTELKEFHHEE